MVPKLVEYFLVNVMYMIIINIEFGWKILNHFYSHFYKVSFSFKQKMLKSTMDSI